MKNNINRKADMNEYCNATIPNAMFPSQQSATAKLLCYLAALMLLLGSCKKIVEVPPPAFSLAQTNVYKSDPTATAVLTGLYIKLARGSMFTGNASLSVYCGLSADELSLWSGQGDLRLQNYYKNALVMSSVSAYGAEFWTPIYVNLFTCNSAIEGLNSSTASGLSTSVKKQLLGESKFMRAILYFYLVNLFGDVPLVLNTDYRVSATLLRTPKADVLNQIIADLKEAQELLSDDFLDGTLTKVTTERVRPTKWVATALLARAYLYTNDYVHAEEEATKIINNSSLFNLAILNDVFLKNSREAIWQLQATGLPPSYAVDGYFFIVPSTGFNTQRCFYCNNNLVTSFESGDTRKTNWMNTYSTGGNTFYYPYKYKITTTGGVPDEYTTVFRLAEQYLIRAEARAQQNNISGAVLDLNMIRTRARAIATTAVPNPLPNLATSITQSQVLTAVAHERQVELFSELGHRWMDLKRTGQVDVVMGNPGGACAAKGGTWYSYQQLYPIPYSDIVADPNLVQNTGY